ncbi:MAG: YitT family protein [Burkholderiaceae bacterium]|nr:YitT family protein [Burkholderiaceae bacterium]
MPHDILHEPSPHSAWEDAQALVTGTLFVALGVAMFKQAGLLTGGTAGIAFLIHYATGWRFGLVFFVVNLPFVWLALRQMGAAFTLKTFVAVGLLSIATELLPHLLGFARLDPAFAAVMGGLVIGAGLLMLFRHHASLGGVNVLALWLQKRRYWRAGTVQLAVDIAILAAAFVTLPPAKALLSLLGAIALNMVVAVNHRPGRYLGV